MIVLECTHSKHEFEQNFCIFLMEINRVIVLRMCPTELPEIRIPIMCRWRGVKMEVQRFAYEFGLEIFFLYSVINRLEIKFWVKNTLGPSYSQAVIALKMC